MLFAKSYTSLMSRFSAASANDEADKWTMSEGQIEGRMLLDKRRNLQSFMSKRVHLSGKSLIAAATSKAKGGSRKS